MLDSSPCFTGPCHVLLMSLPTGTADKSLSCSFQPWWQACIYGSIIGFLENDIDKKLTFKQTSKVKIAVKK